MKAMYHNFMENVLKERLIRLFPYLDCCTCDICQSDIIAYALNRLPSKYVVTHTGEVYSKIYTLRQQHDTDIVAALTQGANMVKENPRHSAEDIQKHIQYNIEETLQPDIQDSSEDMEQKTKQSSNPKSTKKSAPKIEQNSSQEDTSL